MVCRIIVLGFLCLNSFCLSAQKNSNISIFAGYGYYEAAFAGARYTLDSKIHSLAVLVGSTLLHTKYEGYFTIGAEFDVALFRNKSTRNGRYVWFLQNKATYLNFEDVYYHWQILAFIPTLSRRYYFSDKISISADVGAAFNLVLKSKDIRRSWMALPYTSECWILLPN